MTNTLFFWINKQIPYTNIRKVSYNGYIKFSIGRLRDATYPKKKIVIKRKNEVCALQINQLSIFSI
ncbi:hypothetical protein EV194_11155 [Natronoflexus pectinivorans]|uniref:Uncharacterized protein n=1 Tax=Natronoflexus pectinivorans TaxID=682526 RepID=A0A4R2GI29_9BACT|nr:hypothetical protein EV194_11155 [Natronoflexus pectinivorans]